MTRILDIKGTFPIMSDWLINNDYINQMKDLYSVSEYSEQLLSTSYLQINYEQLGC